MSCTSFPPTPRLLFRQIQRSSTKPWYTRSPPPPLLPAAIQHLFATIQILTYSRCLSAAVAVFSHLRHRLSHPSSTHLDYPISSLLDAAAAVHSLSHGSQLLSHPSSTHLDYPISSLLDAAAAVHSLSHGSQLHSLSLSLGLHPANHFIVSRLAALYAACGLLDVARAAVKESSVTLAFPWNILISAYVRNGSSQDAIFCYGMMLERGIRPDNFTVSSVLSACGELRELWLGQEVHKRVASSGVECDLFVCNALLAMYCKCGAVDDARKLFDEMAERDVVSWNSMILGYTSEGRWGETSEMLEMMQLEGFDLNSVTSNTIIYGHVRLGNYTEALRLISQMIPGTDISAVDPVSLVLGLKACTEMGYLKQGKEIHSLAIRSGCHKMENISNCLITLYSRCNNPRYAAILFQKSPSRNIVTWNAMIAASAVTNSIQEAILTIQEMIESKTEPNQTTIVIMLALCADAADLLHGKELHCYATRHGFEHYLPIANSLVDMYCKSGRVSHAHMVFNLMVEHDKISYTVLIAGYVLQRKRMVALRLFHEMISRGIKPDQIATWAARSAWSRSWNQGGSSRVGDHSSVATLLQND